MALLDVVFRALNKAGDAFVELRREDGHGSSAGTPSHVVLPDTQVGLTRAELDSAPVIVDTGITQPTTPNDVQPVTESAASIIAKAVDAPNAATTTIATPASGKAIRLWWYNIGAHPTNTAPVVVSLRFGDAGTDFYKTALSQYGAATAHSFKSGKSFVQGAVDQPLVLNKDVAQMVYVNIDYEEVTP